MLRTARLLVPFADVVPPAYESALPCTMVLPVRSTGSFGSGSCVRTLAACAGAAAGGGASCGAAVTGGGSGCAVSSGAGGGGGGGSSFITSISCGALAASCGRASSDASKTVTAPAGTTSTRQHPQ